MSVSFGVPTVANMTRKNKGATTTNTASGLTAAVHVASSQTNLEEADSESSMPCSLPDDVANKYAQYVLPLIAVSVVLICFI